MSLTTVRDATELDSDQDSYVTKQITTKNIKQHRTLIHKANDNDDTDSDSVFTEVFSIYFSFFIRVSFNLIDSSSNCEIYYFLHQYFTQGLRFMNNSKDDILFRIVRNFSYLC